MRYRVLICVTRKKQHVIFAARQDSKPRKNCSVGEKALQCQVDRDKIRFSKGAGSLGAF